MSNTAEPWAQPVQIITLPVLRRGAVEASRLSELLRLMQVEEGITPMTDSQPVSLCQVRAGDTLFHEGGRAETVHFVRVGTFKIFTTAEDGYEQVVGFAERAEMLGFDALASECHPTAAVALEDAWVFNVRTPDLFTWCQAVPALNRALHHASSRQIARSSELADVMAAVVAEVRLARFLVHLAGHREALGHSPRRFVLRMTRRDLASYLGVAHETVSRAFSALAQWGCLRVCVREVEIVDFERLKSFGRCTRSLLAEPAAPNRSPRRAVRTPVDRHVSTSTQALST